MAIFPPNLGRATLGILSEALVCNVNLKDSTAISVKCIHWRGTHEAHAKQEIIISAEVYPTPQILEFSGIRNPEILKAARVECLVTNPEVGVNFQVQVASGAVYYSSDGKLFVDSLHKPEMLEQLHKIYMET